MARAVDVRFGFVDQKGKKAQTILHVPNGFTLTDYDEFGAAMGQLMANITETSITQGSIGHSVDLSGLSLKTVAISLASIARKLRLRFTTAVTGFIAKTLIPSPNESLVGAGSDDFNQADPDVAAVISFYEDGVAVTGGTMTLTNGRDHDIVSVVEAKEKFLRRRRRS